MGSRRTGVALRRRAAIALGVWAIALAMLAVAAAMPEGPTAVLRVDNAYPAIGDSVRFNASSSTGHDAGNGRIVAFRFGFGDGQGTGWQDSPITDHAYAEGGTFVANVTVADNRGQQATASVTLRVGVSPPPSTGAPWVVPIQATVTPAQPRANDSVTLTAVILNRGDVAASRATVTGYDLPPNAAALRIGNVTVPTSIPPSQTVSITLRPFVVLAPGNHTLRIVVTNVTPAEANATGRELDVRMSVASGQGSGGGPSSGPSFAVSSLVLGLGAAAVAAGAGAAVLLRRRPPRGPLEPPPESPPDQSPPPIWPL